MDSYLAPALLTPVLGLLQSLEDNFALAVAMFIIGFICTVTTIIAIVAMHRFREQPRAREEEDRT